jgi:urease accessory protein
MMPSQILPPDTANVIQDEILELEKRLKDAKARLNKVQPSPPLSVSTERKTHLNP